MSSAPSAVIDGPPGGFYQVETSPDLVHWFALDTAFLDNAFTLEFGDYDASGAAHFYRLLQLPSGTMWFDPVDLTPSGSVTLTLHGQPGKVCEIQVSSGLVHWSVTATATNYSGTVTFSETVTGLPRRFYRARVLQ